MLIYIYIFKINVNFPQLLYFAVLAAVNAEYWRFWRFCFRHLRVNSEWSIANFRVPSSNGHADCSILIGCGQTMTSWTDFRMNGTRRILNIPALLVFVLGLEAGWCEVRGEKRFGAGVVLRSIPLVFLLSLSGKLRTQNLQNRHYSPFLAARTKKNTTIEVSLRLFWKKILIIPVILLQIWTS